MLAGEAELVLVLGSQNSSNSQRLAELARERGVPAHLIDGPDDIDAGVVRRRRTRCWSPPAPAPRRVVVEEVPRLAPRAVRRDGRAALDPRGERVVPAAARAAAICGARVSSSRVADAGRLTRLASSLHPQRLPPGTPSGRRPARSALLTGVPAPWPARVSIRSRIGASPAWARCSAAANLKLCIGTTRSSVSAVMISVAGYFVPSLML